MMLLLNVLRMYLLNIYQVYYINIMYILNKVLLLLCTLAIIIIIEFAETKNRNKIIKKNVVNKNNDTSMLIGYYNTRKMNVIYLILFLY